MMDILLKTAIQAEITQVLVIQEIMHHHQEIILTMIMVILVHVMTIHQEAIVIEMAMVVTVTIQIIQVEVPIEIHMRVMVTHVVLHEGPCYLMVEAVAKMITAAHMMDMVEVETVTQAAKVISTQVVVIGLADKKGRSVYSVSESELEMNVSANSRKLKILDHSLGEISKVLKMT